MGLYNEKFDGASVSFWGKFAEFGDIFSIGGGGGSRAAGGSGRVFDTLFAPWFSHSPTLQPFEAYFFVKF